MSVILLQFELYFLTLTFFLFVSNVCSDVTSFKFVEFHYKETKKNVGICYNRIFVSLEYCHSYCIPKAHTIVRLTS